MGELYVGKVELSLSVYLYLKKIIICAYIAFLSSVIDSDYFVYYEFRKINVKFKFVFAEI